MQYSKSFDIVATSFPSPKTLRASGTFNYENSTSITRTKAIKLISILEEALAIVDWQNEGQDSLSRSCKKTSHTDDGSRSNDRHHPATQ
jgi:hypothetical protein